MFGFNLSKGYVSDFIKTALAVKVAVFLILSGVESVYEILESIEFDDCVDKVTLKLEEDNSAFPGAKAVHYCEGGDLVNIDN